MGRPQTTFDRAPVPLCPRTLCESRVEAQPRGHNYELGQAAIVGRGRPSSGSERCPQRGNRVVHERPRPRNGAWHPEGRVNQPLLARVHDAHARDLEARSVLVALVAEGIELDGDDAARRNSCQIRCS